LIAPVCEKGLECTAFIYYPFIIGFGLYKAISMGTLYGSVSLVVEKDMIPLAFGILTALSNILSFTCTFVGAELIGIT